MKLSRRSFIIVLGGLCAPIRGAEPQGQRVFVCAHSFMIFTARLLPAVAKSAGIAHVAAGQQMLGGSRVIQHWNLPDARNVAKTALREGRVDVLTLSPHFLLPDPGIDNFTKLGLEKNPNLRVLVQSSWPGFDGEEPWSFRNEQRNAATVESIRKMREGHRERWFGALEEQVRALNKEVKREAVFILPVSDAVFALRERIAKGEAPGLNRQTDLFRDPIGHPQGPLAVLVTYCHFAAIYQRSPLGLPVPAELQAAAEAPALNRLLQELAWEAVSEYPMSGLKAARTAARR
jgi:hypothetical protein